MVICILYMGEVKHREVHATNIKVTEGVSVRAKSKTQEFEFQSFAHSSRASSPEEFQEREGPASLSYLPNADQIAQNTLGARQAVLSLQVLLDVYFSSHLGWKYNENMLQSHYFNLLHTQSPTD